MLITTTEELRLYSPANAIDHIGTLAGFIDSSEHDFLEEKLGTALYAALQSYYRDMGEAGIEVLISNIQANTTLPPYAQLLVLAQRCVCFDALGRAIDMQAVSVNGAGVNMVTSDDYDKADKDAINAYKQTCYKEAHVAVNRLLVVLETWMKEVTAATEDEQKEETYTEKKEITDLWQQSRFYFLAAGLLIPSASVMQEYVNIYDNREKYIQLLPDIRYIQEDILAPIIGEDLMDFLVETATNGTTDKVLARLIHRLRKAMARHLTARMSLFKLSTADKDKAHDEAVQLTNDCANYIRMQQQALVTAAKDAMQTSPCYDPKAEKASAPYEPTFKNNEKGNVIFVTPALN